MNCKKVYIGTIPDYSSAAFNPTELLVSIHPSSLTPYEHKCKSHKKGIAKKTKNT